MAEYRESSISGTKYTRTPRVIVENPHEGVPVMQVVEEEVFVFEGGIKTSVLQGVTITEVFDALKTYPLRNPLTDELLGGTGTHADLQVYMYSLVRALQLARDEAQAQALEEQVV